MYLKSIAEISLGYPFRGRIEECPGSGVFAVQMKNISPIEGINWDTVVETEIEGKRDPSWLSEGDILFTARGNRNYAVIVDRTKNNTVSAPHFYEVRPDKSRVLPEFLVWYLNQAPAQKYFDKEAEGTFTKNIRRSVLEKLTIALPDIETQKKIVALHETLQHEKRMYEELIENGNQLMNGLAQELLQDGTNKKQR